MSTVPLSRADFADHEEEAQVNACFQNHDDCKEPSGESYPHILSTLTMLNIRELTFTLLSLLSYLHQDRNSCVILKCESPGD